MRHRRRRPRGGPRRSGTGLIVWTETLAGDEIERRVPGRATPKNMAVTPVRNCLCAQDDLEPVLRRFAEARRPGELRFNTEVTSFSQEGGRRHRHPDRSHERRGDAVHARYLIAADGAQSRVRRALGVTMIGEERVYDSVNILFNADLTPWVDGPAGRALLRRAGRSARAPSSPSTARTAGAS